MNYKGPYNLELLYMQNDIVLHDGSSYICRRPSRGICPATDNGANWSMLASRGIDGMNGVDGAVGPAGQSAIGVPSGGNAGDVLVKTSSDDFATSWDHIDCNSIGAASKSHTHTSEDIADLSAMISTRAAASHTHAIKDVDGLESKLDFKSDCSHKHNASDIVSGNLSVDSVDTAMLVVDGMIVNDDVISTGNRLTLHVDGVDALSIVRDSVTMNSSLRVRSLRISDMNAPASSASPGEPGDICWDRVFMYICVQKNTWKRIALQDW